MIITIADATSLRIAPSAYWQFTNVRTAEVEILDRETGIVFSSETVSTNAGITFESDYDESRGGVHVRVDEAGDRFDGLLVIEPDTLVQLVGN